MEVTLTSYQGQDARGFSVIELLIVVTMISVISGFAFIQIARARQEMTRQNAARQFVGYLEKARLDSIRRHPTAPAQMGQVSIVDANSYSVRIDSDGDGTLNAPLVISLPANSNLQFNGPFPRTIYFNWRGRTVDSTTAVVTPAAITISNSDGTSPTTITMTTAGQPAINTTITTTPVANSTPQPASLRNYTQIP